MRQGSMREGGTWTSQTKQWDGLPPFGAEDALNNTYGNQRGRQVPCIRCISCFPLHLTSFKASNLVHIHVSIHASTPLSCAPYSARRVVFNLGSITLTSPYIHVLTLSQIILPRSNPAMPLLVPIFVPRGNISLALSPIFTSASLLNTGLALFASLSRLYLFPSVIFASILHQLPHYYSRLLFYTLIAHLLYMSLKRPICRDLFIRLPGGCVLLSLACPSTISPDSLPLLICAPVLNSGPWLVSRIS